MSTSPKGPRVYLASKLYHAPMWRDWKANKKLGITIVSTWHDNINIEADDHDIAACRSGWIENICDIRGADAMLVYGMREEALNGTLVEIGAALHSGVDVYLVGTYPWGTWRHLRKVNHSPDLHTAIHDIRQDLS